MWRRVLISLVLVGAFAYIGHGCVKEDLEEVPFVQGEWLHTSDAMRRAMANNAARHVRDGMAEVQVRKLLGPMDHGLDGAEAQEWISRWGPVGVPPGPDVKMIGYWLGENDPEGHDSTFWYLRIVFYRGRVDAVWVGQEINY